VDSFNPQHLLLPLSNISKLMKASVPLDSKISNSSKLMVQSCVSEMISFVAAEANDQVLAEKRRTLNGVDLLCAFKRLGFDAYYEALQIYLAKYRTVANESGKRHRRPRADDDDDVVVDVDVDVDEGQGGTNEMPARPTKRAKIAHTRRGRAREEATDEG